MVIVRFNQWTEFLDELKSKPPDDRTVRLTFSLRYDGQGAPHLTMVAGYLDHTTIVEFVQYLGLEPVDRKSPRTQEIKALYDERRKLLGELGFAVKSGRYHVPPSLQR
jgi:hypothetical protein